MFHYILILFLYIYSRQIENDKETQVGSEPGVWHHAAKCEAVAIPTALLSPSNASVN